MDFIKQMKKREFIEMGLKTLASLLIVFLTIILMEGMIFSIQLDGLLNAKSENPSYGEDTVVYCIEDKEKEGYYKILYFNEDVRDEGFPEWSVSIGLTSEEVIAQKYAKNEVHFRTPNAFELSIEGFHFIIMGFVVAAVAGFFIYKFVRLNSAYNKIEEQFLKDGTIEITA